MRPVIALLIVTGLAAGCVPDIPVKSDFGASGLVATGDTAPEFAQFNAYDPKVAGLVANQVCTSPYIPLEEKDLGGAPGRIIQVRGRCRQHTPIVGDDESYLPNLSW